MKNLPDVPLSNPKAEWIMPQERRQPKGSELQYGDVVNMDGTPYRVTASPADGGKLQRIAGIRVPYDSWFSNLLVKLHLKDPKMWRDTIIIYPDIDYSLIGSMYSKI
jgi:hypothetical protein